MSFSNIRMRSNKKKVSCMGNHETKVVGLRRGSLPATFTYFIRPIRFTWPDDSPRSYSEKLTAITYVDISLFEYYVILYIRLTIARCYIPPNASEFHDVFRHYTPWMELKYKTEHDIYSVQWRKNFKNKQKTHNLKFPRLLEWFD